MALAADDDVVVNGDAEGCGAATICFVMSMSAREGVGSPEGWLCTRMMARGGQLQRALHHLAHVDRRVVDGALAAAPRRRSAGSSCRGTGCGTARASSKPMAARQIVEHRVPGCQHRALHDARRASGAARAARTSFSSVTTASPTPLTSLSRSARRIDDLGERAEALQQPLGERLGVAAGDGAEQHQLQQLVVGQRLGAAAAEALLQPLAMAGMRRVRRFEKRALAAAAGRGPSAAAHRAPAMARAPALATRR